MDEDNAQRTKEFQSAQPMEEEENEGSRPNSHLHFDDLEEENEVSDSDPDESDL